MSTERDAWWLIEDVWTTGSGTPLYLHKSFDVDAFLKEHFRDVPSRRRTEQIVTSDPNEAMRFETQEAALAWFDGKPHWLTGGQYEVREHMFLAQQIVAAPREGTDMSTEREKLIAEATDRLVQKFTSRFADDDLIRRLRDALSSSGEAQPTEGWRLEDLTLRIAAWRWAAGWRTHGYSYHHFNDEQLAAAKELAEALLAASPPPPSAAP